jgi:hypothetical protein
MLAAGNCELQSPPTALSDGILMADLLAFLKDHPNLPLVFLYGGREVKPGYHVTEVKAGHFSALDCGANPEAWAELFVQLWDVQDGDRTHMHANKFSAIIGKVADHVSLDYAAKLTFEVSDGVVPMQLYQASAAQLRNGRIDVSLIPRVSSCKPRDRWLATQTETTSGKESATSATRCCA